MTPKLSGRARCVSLQSIARFTFLGAVLLALPLRAEAAAPIQRVVSPGGITAWLIESHNLPMLTMGLSFKGGSSQDPDDRPGVANFAKWMMNEGAGEIKTQELLEAMSRLGAGLDRSLDADEFAITFTTLTKQRDASFDILRDMLQKPRFDDDSMARGRKSILTDIESGQNDPGSILTWGFMSALFEGHPYARNPLGTTDSVKAITRQDLETYRRSVFARDNMTISVVGDIDAAELATLLDRLLGGLPAHAQLKPMAKVPGSVKGQQKRIAMDLTQTTVRFGYVLDKISPNADMPALNILNHILSGGLLISRLDTEVRVKRGLVYSIGCNVDRWHQAQVVLGVFGANPEQAEQALAITKDEIRKLAEYGPTEEEIEDAKSALKDSFLTPLSSSKALVAYMQYMQQYGYGMDRLDTYAGSIDRVTASDLRRVAKEVFKLDAFTVVAAGKS
jgi:zinc protease